MQFDDDRLPYEKPTLLCLTLDLGIVKGGSNEGDEELMGCGVEQVTQEQNENPDPLL